MNRPAVFWRRRLALVTTATVCFLSALLPAGDSVAQQGALEVLTLDQAIERALESNLLLKQLDEERKAASYRRQIAISQLPAGASSFELLQADLEEDLAAIRLADQRKAIESQVYQAYYGVKLAEAALELRRTALRSAEETLRIARSGYEAGVNTKIDVLGAESQVAQAAAAVDSAEKDLEVAWLGLNQLMNEPFDRRYNLTTLLLRNRPYDVDLEEAIKTAIEFDAGVRSARRNIEFHQDMPGSGGLMAAHMARRVAEQDVERRVRQAYLEMWSAYAQLEPFDKAVELAEEQLRLASMRFEAGIGTHAEVLAAQRQLSEAQLGRLQALFELNRARAQFRLLTESGSSRG